MQPSDLTMWKFSNFPATLILREINFADFTRSKTVVLTIFEALHFDYWRNLALGNDKGKKKLKIKIQSCSKGQNGSFCASK